MTERWSWLAMAIVLAAALFVGVTEDRAPRTENDRVKAIAAEVRCPTCKSLSAAESDAAAAQAVRDEIRARLREGQSQDEILAFLAGRYGRDILLRPEGSGVAGLVWVLPVTLVLIAIGGMALAFRRSRAIATRSPSDEDRALVEGALGP
jgi:cytochrome c-type biogenesis protein CcmH